VRLIGGKGVSLVPPATSPTLPSASTRESSPMTLFAGVRALGAAAECREFFGKRFPRKRVKRRGFGDLYRSLAGSPVGAP